MCARGGARWARVYFEGLVRAGRPTELGCPCVRGRNVRVRIRDGTIGMAQTSTSLQLAVDLLLENVPGAQRVGHVVHPALLPMVGNAPPTRATVAAGGPAAASVVTAGEVYLVKAEGLAVVQLRSPLARSGRGNFRDALAAWLIEVKPSRVVVLSGADATERVESQLAGTQARCVLSDGLQGEAEELNKLECPTLELREPSSAAPDGIYVHGGGIARRLFHACTAGGLDACILLHFCSPGDNQREAHALVRVVASWLGLKPAPSTWVTPLAWEMSFAPQQPLAGLY